MSHSTESSLTPPEDRDQVKRWMPDQMTPPLTDEQTSEAMKSLNIKSYVEKFPKVDRVYADPRLELQTYGLISFVPAKGATPNENGVFGFAKLRGNFATQLEADARSEKIIRNHDSYHSIFQTYVGRPFPMTEKSTYSADISEIDIRKQTAMSMSTSIKLKKDEEQEIIQEIKDKEKELKADVQGPEDPYDRYITLKVKKAQLTWNWLEHQNKMDELKTIILKTRSELEIIDTEHPDYGQKYLEKYMDARKESGFVNDKKEWEKNFMKFMVEDDKDALPF
jgi:hypothetical protein